MDNKTGILVAFAVGAAAGGVAALLLAPDRGENTRRRIREETDRLVKDAKTKAGSTADEVRSTLSTQGKAVKEAVQTARETYRSELEQTRS
jgi:gas vesicle protein